MNVGPGYMELISMAQANSQNKEKELQRRQNLTKEKKMNPKEVKLKVGVQKFLAKKEEEERRKREEANKKKKQLMELRNQDRKANSRVRRMINMTKSANKSVIADARECLSESCIEQASEAQPDEDDYGYTSTYANEMYNKMLQKYQSDAKKEPSHWSKLVGPKIHHIKTSVPPGKESTSKNSSKHNSSKHNVENIANNSNEMPKPPKKKPPPPPPPGFDELLKLAEQKSKEPITIKNPTKESFNGPEFEFGRPMTAREKKTFMQEQELKQRAQAAFSGNQPAKSAVTSVPKISESTTNHPKSIPIPKLVPNALQKPTLRPQEPVTTKKASKDSFVAHELQVGRLLLAGSKKVPESSSKPRTPATVSQAPKTSGVNNPTRTHESAVSQPKNIPTSSSKLSRPPTASTKVADAPKRPRPYEPVTSHGWSQQQQSQRPSMPPPPTHKRDKPRKGRAIIESDEDYDSEMDDFIDDSDVPGEDISSMIGQMFGYNKRKYVNEESDDECMESSVEQQMREEARTLRLGVLEDLEDMKMEEEEKKRKAAFLKKRKLK